MGGWVGGWKKCNIDIYVSSYYDLGVLIRLYVPSGLWNVQMLHPPTRFNMDLPDLSRFMPVPFLSIYCRLTSALPSIVKVTVCVCECASVCVCVRVHA